jgi:YD repeat-containing protein
MGLVGVSGAVHGKKTTRPGLAATWYEYDDLGSLVRTGLDLDGTNGLQLASTDRITDTDTTYVSISNAWWKQTVRIVYPTDDSSAPTTNSIVRVAAGGSGCGCGAGESVSIDVHGNETVTTLAIDAASNTVTRAANYPDSTNEAVTVTVNGLLQSSESKTGIETVYRYDPLGRLVGAIDPRTGTNTTHYAATGLVDWVEDPASNRTEFAYPAFCAKRVVNSF